MNSSYIPVVDMSCVVDGVEKGDPLLVRDLVQQITHALSSTGFMYIKNHGIHQDQSLDVVCRGSETQLQVDNAMRESATFFELSDDIKSKFRRVQENGNHGWVKWCGESLNPERPGDLKETFNMSPAQPGGMFWPDVDTPMFKPALSALYTACRPVLERLLILTARGLGLEDENYFVSRHNPDEPSHTTLRSLYYPQVESSEDIKPGQMRCGEHSDYGSLTLLFQDDVGGLEVLHRDGEYVQARPLPGTVVVNIGDLMQRWTADKLVSTKHRVVALQGGDKPRQSIACFFHPNLHREICCVDGSGKYPPTTDAAYIAEKFKASY